MIKEYFLLFFVAGALALAGCASNVAAADVGTNCGADETCLVNAAIACSQAYGTTTQTAEMTNMSIVLHVGIQGGTTSNCTFYFRADDVSIPGADTAQQLVIGQMLLGTDMLCYFESPANASEADIGGIVDSSNLCHGPFADALQTIALLVSDACGEEQCPPCDEEQATPPGEGETAVPPGEGQL